ncbi:DKNYY domain-containing protein [Lacrimispora brassicae]
MNLIYHIERFCIEMKEPKIQYALWQSAYFFANTGQNYYEIIKQLGLSIQEWNFYSQQYNYFYVLDEYFTKYKYDLKPFGIEKLDNQLQSHLYFFEEEYHELMSPTDTISSFSRKIQKRIFENPYIGIFQNVPWKATFIARHPWLSACMFSHDDHHLYCCGEIIKNKKNEEIHPIDLSQFKVLNRHYLTDKKNVFVQKQKSCRDLYPVFMPLKNVDMPSFKTVGEEYACDEKRVYFYTNRSIQSPSAYQLQIFYENIKKSSGIVYPVETGYALDRHFVYYKGKILSEHPLSFQQFGLSGYFTDGMDVFYTGKKLSADIATFEIIDTQHAEDQNYVFSGAMVYKEK